MIVGALSAVRVSEFQVPQATLAFADILCIDRARAVALSPRVEDSVSVLASNGMLASTAKASMDSARPLEVPTCRIRGAHPGREYHRLAELIVCSGTGQRNGGVSAGFTLCLPPSVAVFASGLPSSTRHAVIVCMLALNWKSCDAARARIQIGGVNQRNSILGVTTPHRRFRHRCRRVNGGTEHYRLSERGTVRDAVTPLSGRSC